MAQTSNRLLDEFARLVTDAAGAAQGVRREVETVARGQLERILADMDLARREEVEVLRDLAVAAREESEGLRLRVEALERRVEALSGASAAPGSDTATQA